MKNLDAWTDFSRTLVEHLHSSPSGSSLSVRGPDHLELVIWAVDEKIILMIMDDAPISPDQAGSLRDLDWIEHKGRWIWHARAERAMEHRVAMAIVKVLAGVIGVNAPGLVRTFLMTDDGSGSLAEQMILQTAPVTLDTTGLESFEQGFVDPSTGAGTFLNILDYALDYPYWLDDLDLARREFAREYASAGCLIEADPITVSNVRGMAQIWKTQSDQDHGMTFGASVIFAKTTQAVNIMHLMKTARGTAGAREAIVTLKLQNYLHREPHPYDAELFCRLPFHRADDEVWDEQFPGHPLTCVRAWLHDLDRIVTFDPAFAALPDFHGTMRQSRGR